MRYHVLNTEVLLHEELIIYRVVEMGDFCMDGDPAHHLDFQPHDAVMNVTGSCFLPCERCGHKSRSYHVRKDTS